MACTASICTADKIFLFINIAFAMYSGALLATAARLAWDPSTYTWFRFLCAAQYRVSAAYVAGSGLWLAALVYLAAAAAGRRRPRARCLHLYCGGVACLALSELCYGAWMGASLAAWWRSSPQAELARRAIDLLHDLKPALLAVERYRDVAQPLLEMIEEVEHEAPNNVYVIIIFGVFGMFLQVAAFVMARRLARRGAASQQPLALAEKAGAGVVRGEGAARGEGAGSSAEDDSDGAESASAPIARAPGWRKNANLRMYTILDKIF